ncbi:calmodulin-like protein 30 [Macadamia integrifolia]|uniref:calmodulin-like protein 30 n=1 Tax=Macadamia integrifolia TaxID=60698 RepID=UPI001C50037C|nr:calmodulin-like protein 30 [Macadamia integrifolia]
MSSQCFFFIFFFVMQFALYSEYIFYYIPIMKRNFHLKEEGSKIRLCAYSLFIIARISPHSSISMSRISFLDFQYGLSKRLLPKANRLGSVNSRQYSGLSRGFQPNVNEMKRVFDKFDSNEDGKISFEEYCSLLKALGKPHVDREVEKIFQVADLDGDGFIDFKEFMDVQQKGGGIRTMDIRNAFHMFDLDGNGKISVEEVQEMLRRLGESCSHKDCMEMVRGVDTNGDGFIDMDEFINMMTNSLTPT